MPNLPPLPALPDGEQFAVKPYYHLLPLDHFTAGSVPLPGIENGFTPKDFPIGNTVAKCWSVLSFEQLGVDERRIADVGSQHYPEPDSSLDVSLYVYTDKKTFTTPRDRHWGIRWILEHTQGRKNPHIFTPAVRCLEVTSNIDSYNNGPHLVNWGPITSPSKFATKSNCAVLKLGKFTKAQRLMMEAIAWQIGVQRPPDGEYNCQNWCTALFALAIGYGLLTEEKVNSVMKTALLEEIPGTIMISAIYNF
ncbi:hypothetical protein D9758_017519 [Tetrapyrgos nigripes]|uniref:Uncharacterized protein n=1 Tax=Tetrapyrgos nigripes TaxID=182062 RepID=A0A8H5C2V2_9AGAR|nr:hypothetical protein D9758_017519 [Tetrapyrgos nigripes]